MPLNETCFVPGKKIPSLQITNSPVRNLVNLLSWLSSQCCREKIKCSYVAHSLATELEYFSCNKMLKMSVHRTSKTPSQQKVLPNNILTQEKTNSLCKHLLRELWADLRRGSEAILGQCKFLGRLHLHEIIAAWGWHAWLQRKGRLRHEEREGGSCGHGLSSVNTQISLFKINTFKGYSLTEHAKLLGWLI